jgi:membrane-bound serine protease (ClpP class)
MNYWKFLFLSFFLGILPVTAYTETTRTAYLLTIDGAIGPASSEYFKHGLQKAKEQNAELLILKIDTPGGLDTSMREIIKGILESPVPIVTYVAPQGSRAASAGTYILYASHIAAMAPATNLGAATPVQIGGLPKSIQPEESEENRKNIKKKPAHPALQEKAINDAKAYIRGLAELRGRNADWAVSSVAEAASIPAEEALKLGVIDLIAKDTEELLTKIDHREVIIADNPRLLQTAEITIRDFPMSWKNRLLSIISNPNIAYLLLIIGIYGLILEFSHPGYILPGVVGTICMLLAFYGLHLLPVNFAGVALLLVGIAMMIAEAFVPSFGALGIGGIIAFFIGSVILVDTDIEEFSIAWPLIISLTLLSGLVVIGLVTMAIRARRRPVVSGSEWMIGSLGEAMEDFAETGSVFVQSEIWQAHSSTPLHKGDKIKVVGRKAFILEVEPTQPL